MQFQPHNQLQRLLDCGICDLGIWVREGWQFWANEFCLMDRKRDNWIFVSIMCLGNNAGWNLVQVFIKPKVLWIISIRIFVALLKLYHMVMKDICWPLLMITLERIGYISWNIRIMPLRSSSNRKPWSKSRLENISSAWELTIACNFVGKNSMSSARMKIL